MFGQTELIIILVIVVVVFGASRLPLLGKGLGQGIRDFKKALKENDDEEETPSKVPKGRSNPEDSE